MLPTKRACLVLTAGSTGSFKLGPLRLDERSGELVTPRGTTVLADKPLALLLALLEEPGGLVTREELRRRLWPDGTVVDFEDGLNHAVRQLREILGDDAHHPRYVETVPRRGYRYVGDVERVDAGRPEVDAGGRPEAGEKGAAGRSARRPGTRLAFALVLLALSGAWAWLGRSRPPNDHHPRVVQLTSSAGRESQPALSPDGRQVAFVWNGESRSDDEVYVQLVGGGPALRLTSDPADESVPAWSPDGLQIAFRRQTARGASLHTVPALGGPERRVADLGPGRGRLPSLSWTPDGRWIVTSAVGADGRDVLIRVSVDRGERLPLGAASAWAETAPALSPDGRDLAYGACDARWMCDVVLVPVGGDAAPTGAPRRLVAAAGTIYGIAWAPDGRSVVYSATGPGGSATYLWRVPSSGAGRAERLDLAGPGALYPSFSRSGRRLAYSRTSQDWDVWRAQDGRPPEAFIASTRADANPQISPDGTRVAFCSNRTTRTPNGEDALEIFVAARDGASPVPLTDGPGFAQCSPQWSPDGTRVAFDSEARDGRYDVFVVDASGGPARPLETRPADRYDEHNPSWSRDGRWLYFTSNRSGSFEIWRVSAGGGEAERVTQAGGFFALESVDGRTLYYVKGLTGGQPLYARAVSGGPERRLFDGVRFKSFVVVEDGVYYLSSRSDGRPGGEVRFFDFATATSRVAASIDAAPYFGLAVSADRRTLLFTARKQPDDDLLLIENLP